MECRPMTYVIPRWSYSHFECPLESVSGTKTLKLTVTLKSIYIYLTIFMNFMKSMTIQLRGNVSPWKVKKVYIYQIILQIYRYKLWHDKEKKFTGENNVVHFVEMYTSWRGPFIASQRHDPSDFHHVSVLPTAGFHSGSSWGKTLSASKEFFKSLKFRHEWEMLWITMHALRLLSTSLLERNCWRIMCQVHSNEDVLQYKGHCLQRKRRLLHRRPKSFNMEVQLMEGNWVHKLQFKSQWFISTYDTRRND